MWQVYKRNLVFVGVERILGQMVIRQNHLFFSPFNDGLFPRPSSLFGKFRKRTLKFALYNFLVNQFFPPSWKYCRQFIKRGEGGWDEWYWLRFPRFPLGRPMQCITKPATSHLLFSPSVIGTMGGRYWWPNRRHHKHIFLFITLQRVHSRQGKVEDN